MKDRSRGTAAVPNILDTPVPDLTASAIADLLSSQWGITVPALHVLASERDANIMLNGDLVLKVSNPAEDPEGLAMENAAMGHIATVAPDLPIPVLIPTLAGDSITTVVDGSGARCLARLITVLPGAAAEGQPITLDLAEQIGALAARTSIALQGLFHPGGGRILDWDVRRAPQLLRDPAVLEELGAPGRTIEALLPRLATAAAATTALPGGLQHADVTLTNVLITEGDAPTVTGLIDFGDMQHTAAVCDLAVTLTSVLRNTASSQTADTWALTSAVLNGYQRHRTLSHPEVEILGDLVLARLGLTIAISSRRAAKFEDNLDYIDQYNRSTTRVLGELAALPADVLAHRMHRLAGTGRATTPGRGQEDDLLIRRLAVSGGTLSPLFYAKPLQLVRGQGPWLYAADGTRYLDAYNNVAVVGHSHPVIAQALSRQVRLLNTHSRYLHADIVELSERLLATMPPALDTIVFTTSGTEANDLAWRMATACTGGNAAVIAEHAYHGASKWMADLSSNEWPPGYRPEHVGTFAAPRASTGGIDTETATTRIDAAVAHLAVRGDRPALVLADLGFTSEGILDATAGFVAGLVDAAHRGGALFLADEVQSGYGRVGPRMWRFAAAGITPDLVTLGKPMGGGYPMGAVITRRSIAEQLGRDYEYFSTFAGTPGAAASGLAVLDVLENEQIPERVVPVGDHLRDLLRELSAGDQRLGDVRGTGLMAGLDLLGSPGTDFDGRRSFARRVVEGLRDRQVLAGLTGPDGTVLKVRPPLIWARKHADLFAATLSDVLRSAAPDQ